MGLLFTHMNSCGVGCGGAISVTEQRCAAHISKAERHIIRIGFLPYFGAHLFGPSRRSSDWNPLSWKYVAVATGSKYSGVRTGN